MKEIKFTANCMFIGKQNINGVYYPEDVVRSMFSGYVPTVLDERSFGMMDYEPSVEINMDRISHTITDMSLDLENMCVTVTGRAMTNMPMGKVLRDLLDEYDVKMGINPVIIGTINEVDGVETLSSDARILRFDITPESQLVAPQNFIKRVTDDK